MLSILNLIWGLVVDPTLLSSPFVASYVGVMILLSLAELVGMAAVFRLAGRPWWFALIPIWSEGTLLRIVAMSRGWLALMVAPVVLTTLFGDGETAGFVVFAPGEWMATIVELASIILSFFICLKLAECFRRSGLFALGLFFFSFVFLNILGFGENRYRKPLEVPD